MSSVTCRNCRADNPVGSKFCNNCGAQLPPSTSLICPNCQTANPRHLLYCDNCGTRLLPEEGLPFDEEPTVQGESTPSKPRPFSLPMREAGDTDDLDLSRLPEWLSPGGEAASQHEGEMPGSPAGDVEPEGFDVAGIVGDWLSEDLAESQDSSDQVAASEGLDDNEQTGERPEPAGDEPSNWWQALGGEIEEQPGEDSDEVPPSWLSELDAGDAGSAGNEPIPDWLSELGAGEPFMLPAAESPALDDSAGSESLADWLKGLPPLDRDTGLEPGRPEDAGPADLDAVELPASSVDDEVPGEGEIDLLPDWLRGGVDGAGDTGGPSAEGTKDSGTDDLLPEWLREGSADLSPESEEPASTEERSAWLPAQPEVDDETNLPDWLVELSEQPAPFSLSESETRAGIESGPSEDRHLPEEPEAQWQAPIEEDNEPTELGMPGWLRDEIGSQAVAGEDLSEWLAAEDEGTDLTETEMPHWLREEVRDTGGIRADDLPDWLSELDMHEPAPVAEAGDEEDLVEAIEQGQLPAEDDRVEAGAAAETAEDDLAELLREMAPRGTGVLEPRDAESADDELAAELDELGLDSGASSVEVPDWLARLAEETEPSVEEEGIEIEGTAAGIADELPADGEFGLIDLEPELLEPELPEPLPGTGELSEDDIPEWLAALAEPDEWPQLADEDIIADIVSTEEVADAFPETTAIEPEQPSPELVGVPKELAKPGLPEWMGEDAGGPTPDAEVSEEPAPLAADELPDWLQELSASQPQMDRVPAGDELLRQATDLGPEWQPALDGLQAFGQEGVSAEEASARLTAAEIPPWLQALRPRVYEGESEEPAADEPVETEGPLVGLQGVIPVGQVIAEPRVASEPRHHLVTKEHRQQVALLTQIARADRPARRIARKGAGSMSVVARLAISAALLALVILGLLLPAAGVELPVNATLPLPDAAQEMFDEINRADGETILVSFEYSPAMAGELDPIAFMLLTHLAKNGSPVITMSQYAAGVALAQLAAERVEGLDSQALGFVPGEAVGLRLLGGCLDSIGDCETLVGQPFAPELQASLADVNLVIVLTGDRDSLVNWIEQVGAQSEIPLLSGVTQALAPLTLPYLAAGQLEGAVEGSAAAAAYEQALLGAGGNASEQQAALIIVQWAVIVLLIGGTLFYGFRALAAEPMKRTGE